MRLVAEAEGENPDDVRVGSILTSDPLFWIIVAYSVAKSIGNVTDWCLDTWKKVEDIRNVRAQTAQLKSFDEKEVEGIFGPKITKQIESAIEEKIIKMTAGIESEARKNELQNGLRPTLRQFLARIERGLTVDVRYLPAPKSDNDAENADEVRETKSAEIHAVVAKLVFPRPVGNPVLQIESANDDGTTDKPTKPK